MALPDIPVDGKFRILVLDDEPDIARLILATLETVGFECHTAVDGISGLTAFSEFDPHLVLTDMMMPAMTGREVVQRIRESSTVPIIVLTALNSESDELQSLKIGADDFLTKPFSPKKLIARVVTQLRRVYRYDDPVTASLGLGSMTTASAAAAWAKCESCGYIGPREKFEKENWRGEVNLICPHCKKQDDIKFNIS